MFIIILGLEKKKKKKGRKDSYRLTAKQKIYKKRKQTDPLVSSVVAYVILFYCVPTNTKNKTCRNANQQLESEGRKIDSSVLCLLNFL